MEGHRTADIFLHLESHLKIFVSLLKITETFISCAAMVFTMNVFLLYSYMILLPLLYPITENDPILDAWK